jgi:hypothetical protein
MNARQLFLPRPLRILFKRGRRIRARMRGHWLTLKLEAGHPRWVASYLAELGVPGRVVVEKQGVLGVLTPQQYLRFTELPKSRMRLEREVEGWTRMKAAGYGDILVSFMDVRNVPEGLVVATEPLAAIDEKRHLETMLPLVQRLVRGAAPKAPEKLPDSIAAGLDFAREAGIDLAAHHIDEADVRQAFSRSLLTGYSHRDLHWRNVLQRNGKPVLIDLKKCEPDRLLCFDILNMVCLSLAATDGANVATQAYEAHLRNWNDPALQPFLDLVDLPRSLWGPAFTLHVAGLFRLKAQSSSWGTDVLLRQVLQRDWRAV